MQSSHNNDYLGNSAKEVIALLNDKSPSKCIGGTKNDTIPSVNGTLPIHQKSLVTNLDGINSKCKPSPMQS